jgi:hypothetical protein
VNFLRELMAEPIWLAGFLGGTGLGALVVAVIWWLADLHDAKKKKSKPRHLQGADPKPTPYVARRAAAPPPSSRRRFAEFDEDDDHEDAIGTQVMQVVPPPKGSRVRK